MESVEDQTTGAVDEAKVKREDGDEDKDQLNQLLQNLLAAPQVTSRFTVIKLRLLNCDVFSRIFWV